MYVKYKIFNFSMVTYNINYKGCKTNMYINFGANWFSSFQIYKPSIAFLGNLYILFKFLLEN